VAWTSRRSAGSFSIWLSLLTSLRCDGTALRTLRWLSGDKDLPGLQQEGALTRRRAARLRSR